MSNTVLPVSPADLLRLGFRESSANEAAQDIAELVHAIFGPFDPVTEEVWRVAEAQELGPADLSSLLADAVAAGDPLAFLAAFPDAQALLRRRMAWCWSTRRARTLRHPTSLDGQTWTGLSGAAQAEVRENLQQLSASERRRVRRGPRQRSDTDTFLLGLAKIYTRYTGYAFHETGLSSHLEGNFIGLAEVILDRLPPLPSGQPRVHPGRRTAGALSTRWRKIKAHARMGSENASGS